MGSAVTFPMITCVAAGGAGVMATGVVSMVGVVAIGPTGAVVPVPATTGARPDDDVDGAAEARGVVEVIADVVTMGADVDADGVAGAVMEGAADADGASFALATASGLTLNQ